MGFAKEYFLGLRREFRMFQDMVQVINEYRAILTFYSLDLFFEAGFEKAIFQRNRIRGKEAFDREPFKGRPMEVDVLAPSGESGSVTNDK
jgi:hypothetical protein